MTELWRLTAMGTAALVRSREGVGGRGDAWCSRPSGSRESRNQRRDRRDA